MVTGFEALGAASAVLQVISFASDLAVACKNAFDGATTPQDDLERHAKEMFEAVGRVQSRCERMATANSRFVDPELQNIAKECRDAAKRLRVEVQYVTIMQAKGNVLKSVRKAWRTSRHQKKLQTLEDSLSRHQQLIKTELASHLCSQSDAMQLQQEQSFHKLDGDVQFLVKQLAQGVTEGLDLVKREHATTRDAFTQEAARAERAINTHTDTQMLDLKTTTEANEQCRAFLKSLKAERMNERYTNVMDPSEASFNQVFATYQEMMAMYCENSDDRDDESEEDDHDDQDSDGEYGWEDQDDVGDDSDSSGYESSERSSVLSNTSDVLDIWSSWDSFISWLQSVETLFYIEGKPGSGKSTLVKYILDHDRTRDLIQEWNPDAIIIRHFFWKIGSHEQNSIKGLWCSLLYQRLEDQPALIQDILWHFQRLSLHTSYYDWSIKDLQAVWEYTTNHDRKHLCIFIDGLDEIRDEDGFSKAIQSIQQLLKFPGTKLCVSTRPEALIMKWLGKTSASGIRLEDLTKHDMVVFVRNMLRPLLPNKPDLYRELRKDLVKKAQGVFLWIHLAIRSLIEGIENHDPEDMLLRRLDGLPEDLETLYLDMWQRLNANNSVYRQTAARYFRYVLLSSSESLEFEWNNLTQMAMLPFSFQIALAENPDIQETFLAGELSIETAGILQICDATNVSIRNRCAGLLELQSPDLWPPGDDDDAVSSNALGKVAFIHRTAHDFLIETEAGRRIIGHESSNDVCLQSRLLKALIYATMVLSSQWGLAWKLAKIIPEITWFAQGWGSSSLEVAFELLDIIRPLYENACIETCDDLDDFRRPFLSFLTHDDRFDDFVISRLTATNSVQMTTDTLRHGWIPTSYKTLSRRLFAALLDLGADPNKCGVISSSYLMPGPHISKVTAFINLLVAFFLSIERPNESLGYFNDFRALRGCKSLYFQTPTEIIAMAVYMARDCNSLNTGVSFCGSVSENRSLGMKVLEALPWDVQASDRYGTQSLIYEINLQFLLLYLLSQATGDTAESVLRGLKAEDLLPKLDNPWIKMRSFLLPNTGQPATKDSIPAMCHRVTPNASYLPKHVIEHFLHSVEHRSTEETMFKIGFERQLDGINVLYDTRTDLGIVTHVIKDTEIEEVKCETMMTGLAHESPHISTYKEAGIIPSAAFLMDRRQTGNLQWSWFPEMLRRLEVAAAIREEKKDGEDTPS